MSIHLLFDCLAWMSALSVRYLFRNGVATPTAALSAKLRFRYRIVLLLGASAGAILCGSLNLFLQSSNALGHSVLGGILGGIAAIELFKIKNHIKGSTGAVWTLPLSVGIAVGRLGCFFAGLPDNTYGTPTTLPWGVDFGDGVLRHPVQLYEATAMLVFAVVAIGLLHRNRLWFTKNGFYLFATFYASQRFVWEFFKPYATVFGHMNVFHLLCLLLASYGIFMLTRERVSR